MFWRKRIVELVENTVEGTTYRIGEPYASASGNTTVSRIERVKGGYKVYNNEGGSTFLIDQYVKSIREE